jgi:NAD+ kinase
MNVAVVGDDADVRRAVEAACDAVSSPADADVVVAAGESALRSVADLDADAPVLPAADRGGPYVVSPSGVADALEAVVAGSFETASHPLLSVSVGDDHVADAAFDASLMTSEPARISEFAVSSGEDPLASIRADGVVVATPLGSVGYARNAGGPVLAPETGLAVVPVAPYATRTDAWVCATDVGLAVARDETAVSLYADADAVCDVSVDDAVRVRADRSVTLVRPPGDGLGPSE